VRCATAIRDAVRRLGLEVRAGLHIGEVERRGDDITGMAVVIGRRICDVAGPGEIVVSRTVTDLVVGSGLTFADRGSQALKGVPGDWQLFSVSG
jgi:class 3 adenylate cyclase